VFEKSISKNVLNNLNIASFEGDYGDAVMHPEIDKFLNFFKKVPLIEIYTNGSIRNTQWYKKIAQYKNLEIVFSIDGLEDTNSYYRINSNWHKIINNATSFIDAGGTAHWKFIVFKHNQHQVEQARTLSKKLGFKSFTVNYTNRNFFGKTSWPVMIDGVYQHNLLANDFVDPTKKNKTHIIASSDKNFKAPQCHKPWLPVTGDTIYINHRGHVLPCCMTSATTWSNGMSDRLFRKIIGNIDDIDLHCHNIEEILNSDFYTHRLKQSWNSIKTAHHFCKHFCS